MEGIYYGYVLQAQKKIIENEKQAHLKKLENNVEQPSSSNNNTKSLFGEHDQRSTLNIGSYSKINYSTFLNPTFINTSNLQ